jgi:hypothetical protein
MPAKWCLEVWREMPRAAVNIGKRSPQSQPKAGSISSAPPSANRANLRSVLRIETDLPGGTKLWLSAGWKEACGLSISAEVATHGGRSRKRPGVK